MRREDQDKINRFSTLHQKEKLLEEELKQKEVCINCRIRSFYFCYPKTSAFTPHMC